MTICSILIRSVFTAQNVVLEGNVCSPVCPFEVKGGGPHVTTAYLLRLFPYLWASGQLAFDWKIFFYCEVKGSFLNTDFCLLLDWLSARPSNQIPNISSWATLSTEQETSEHLNANNNNNKLKKKFLEGISPFVGSLIPQLMMSACNWLLRFTSGVTPADLMTANLAAELFLSTNSL